jgi:hypothetical protein
MLPPWLAPWPGIEPPGCPDPLVCAWAKPTKPTIRPVIRTDEARFLAIEKAFMIYSSISHYTLQQICCPYTLLRRSANYCSLTHRVRKYFSSQMINIRIRTKHSHTERMIIIDSERIW